MKYEQFVNTAWNIAHGYKTAYMLGPWGWPANDKMITRATTQGANAQKNKQWISKAKAADWIFDCVGLIKGILWGWSGDPSKSYGGAGYACNGVPDIGADTMIDKCPGGGSTDFSNIVPGEVVWMPGHIGIYFGSGMVIEATPKWDGGVQVSALLNIPEGRTLGLAKSRTWTKHGKIPYVDYDATPTTSEDNEPSAYAKDAWERAIAAGITDGSRPHGYATREQLVTMLYRAGVFR